MNRPIYQQPSRYKQPPVRRAPALKPEPEPKPTCKAQHVIPQRHGEELPIRYLCSRRADHSGDHWAKGIGRIVKRWTT